MHKPTPPVVPCLHGGPEPSSLLMEYRSEKQFWLLFAAVFLSFPATKDAAMSHVAAPMEIRVIDLPGLILLLELPTAASKTFTQALSKEQRSSQPLHPARGPRVAACLEGRWWAGKQQTPALSQTHPPRVRSLDSLYHGPGFTAKPHTHALAPRQRGKPSADPRDPVTGAGASPPGRHLLLSGPPAQGHHRPGIPLFSGGGEEGELPAPSSAVGHPPPFPERQVASGRGPSWFGGLFFHYRV